MQPPFSPAQVLLLQTGLPGSVGEVVSRIVEVTPCAAVDDVCFIQATP